MKKYKNSAFLAEAFFLAMFFFAVEMIVRVVERFTILDWSTLRIFCSSFVLALFCEFFLALVKKKQTRSILQGFFLFLVTIYSFVQVGFRNFLGMYISVGTGGQMSAVASYIKSFLLSFSPEFYLIFIPFIVFIIYLFLEKKGEKIGKYSLSAWGVGALTTILFSAFFLGTIMLPFMQNPLQLVSNKVLFLEPTNSSIAVNQYGTTMYGLLDIRYLLFPTHYSTEIPVKEPEEEMDDTLWINIINEEKNPTLNVLNKYFQGRTIHKNNEYTGYFEGKNLIVIMMESVNNVVLNKEYFPNFNKMLSNGWYFENNYSPRNACATGDNEFSGMTSLYPLNTSCTVNVTPTNTYFTSIFNKFNQKGYTTSSYHDLDSTYYQRDIFHKKMGSMEYYDGTRLKMNFDSSNYFEWPSDVEFIEKAFPYLSKDTPFMAWMTTVTAHQPYENSSIYGDLYFDLFEDTDYTDTLKRYLSKTKVTDDALGVLLEKLEEKDILKDTVIVLYGDHYPYGLSDEDVQDSVEYDIKDFYEIERTPFLIYNSELEPKVFEEKTFYMNILPTIANLFHLDADSRFYMGEDLMSEEFSSRVVFADGSWEDDIARYNALDSTITYFEEEKTYSIEEIQKINNDIYQKKAMSKLAIEENYFEYLETKLKEKQEEGKKEND